MKVFIAVLLWSSIAFAAEPYTFTTFTVPGAKHTMAFGISDLGDVVGMFGECDFCGAKAFLFSDGKYYDLAVSGAVQTTPFGINRNGVIAGTFAKAGQFAFLMDDVQTTILEATRADAINNRGAAVGYRSGVVEQLGYIYRDGTYVQPVTPAEVPGILGSALTGINDKGDTVGYYFFDNPVCPPCVTTVGFVRKAGGRLLPLEIIPLGINSDGQIVGLSGAGNDGALYDDGVVTLIKIPGADYVQVHGINNKGVLVGYYAKAGVQYGFVGKPAARGARK